MGLKDWLGLVGLVGLGPLIPSLPFSVVRQFRRSTVPDGIAWKTFPGGLPAQDRAARAEGRIDGLEQWARGMPHVGKNGRKMMCSIATMENIFI